MRDGIFKGGLEILRQSISLFEQLKLFMISKSLYQLSEWNALKFEIEIRLSFFNDSLMIIVCDF